MALDLVNEHDAMLSKCGSFWYDTVNRRDKAIAHMFEGMACHTDAVSRLANASRAVLSGGYFHGFNRVFRFKDADISYNGTDKALQALYNGSVNDDGSIVVQDITALSGDGVVSDTREFEYIQPHKTGFGWDEYDKAARPAATGKVKITESGHLSWGTKEHYGWRCMRGAENNDECTWGVKEFGEESLTLDFDKPVNITGLTHSAFVANKAGWGWAQFTLEVYHDSIEEANFLVRKEEVIQVPPGIGQMWFDNIRIDIPNSNFYSRYVVKMIASKDRGELRGHALLAQLKLDATYKDNHLPEADEDRFPVMFPSTEGVNSDMVLPASYRALFGLKVPDDILVTSIEDKDGTLLLEGVDFVAEFGKLWLHQNPTALFPDMKFMAKSFTRRCKNLYCYPLRLDNVYGPVDRVMHYYRVSQSPSAFKYAAAQACGLAVARVSMRIVEVEPLLGGYSYIASSGYRLDAPYPHAKLRRGAVLPAGYIVGEGDLFGMVLPGETDTAINTLDTESALPVRLVVTNKTICTKCVVDGTAYDRPVDCEPGGTPENGNSRFSAYWRWLASNDGGPDEWGDGMEAVQPVSGIDWVRNDACGGLDIVVRINEGVMPYDMQVKLHNFILREAPIGCLLTYSPITSTILED